MDYTKTYPSTDKPGFAVKEFVSVTIDSEKRDGQVVSIREPENLPGYYKYQIDVMGRGDAFWFWEWELESMVTF